jgi:hypothetical protein
MLSSAAPRRTFANKRCDMMKPGRRWCGSTVAPDARFDMTEPGTRGRRVLVFPGIRLEFGEGRRCERDIALAPRIDSAFPDVA